MTESAATTNDLQAPGGDVITERRGTLALVTLNRAKALNALTADMRHTLAAGFADWARDPMIYAVVVQSANPKAFSAGSDVREIVELHRADPEAARQAFRDEYALDWRIECFSKPTVSLIDGLVMGGGVGISLYGTHRVAGEGYKFAMPETAIGLFPDVGVCHALARMPDSIGVYLGLTGRSIDRAAAYALGLVTHCIGRGEFAGIIAGLADTQPVDALLDTRHVDPGADELAPVRAMIAQCFSAASVPEIVVRLVAVDGAHKDWAAGVLQDLATRSPLSLAVTLRHIQQARALDLKQVLEADYRLACHFLDGHDIFEGTRAALIDKDGKPVWRPAAIGDVTQSMIADYFAHTVASAWTLATRAEMQASRA